MNAVFKIVAFMRPMIAGLAALAAQLQRYSSSERVPEAGFGALGGLLMTLR